MMHIERGSLRNSSHGPLNTAISETLGAVARLEARLAASCYQRGFHFDRAKQIPARPDGNKWTCALHISGVPATRGHGKTVDEAKEDAAATALKNINDGIWVPHSHKLEVKKKK